MSRPLSVETIAQRVGYSASRLQSVFHQATGEGLISFLIGLRMDRAKQLLQQTDLSIIEVALETGFTNYTRFAHAFKQRNRVSARAFRKVARATGGQASPESPTQKQVSKEWFRDDFAGRKLGSHWTMAGGRWQQKDSRVVGEGDQAFTIRLANPLPENFEILFGAEFSARSGESPSGISIFLADADFRTTYYSIHLGRLNNTIGELLRRNTILQWNPNALVRKGTSQQVVVSMEDNALRVELDKVEMFRLQDPFPAPYSGRCKIAVGGWAGQIALRGFVIRDRGFRPLIQAVRQGDNLFNSGLVDQARELYLRLLQTKLPFSDIMELRYKIGFCHLHMEHFADARNWFDKVTPLPEGNFWAQKARLAVLETEWREGNFDSFVEQAGKLYDLPAMKDGVREVSIRARQQYRHSGFWERSCGVSQMLCNKESQGSLPWLNELVNHASDFYSLREYAKAEALLRTAINSPGVTGETVAWTRIRLADTLMLQGKFDESLKQLAELMQANRNPAMLARCKMYTGMVLRGQGCFDKATDVWQNISREFCDDKTVAAFAELELASLESFLGDPQKGFAMVRAAARFHPSYEFVRAGMRSYYRYPPELLQGNCSKAAAILLVDARTNDGQFALRAEQAVKAGILLGLANRSNQARTMWAKTIRRFPSKLCCYFAQLAQELIDGNPESLVDMPYGSWVRSEMFCLAGMLMEKQGKQAEAGEYWRKSLEEDPTLRWPALLAKTRLRS